MPSSFAIIHRRDQLHKVHDWPEGSFIAMEALALRKSEKNIAPT